MSDQKCYRKSSIWIIFWRINRDFLEGQGGRKGSLKTQPCPTLCNPMDCSPQGSSVNGILQARILEWVAIPFSRGSSQLGDQTQVSCIAGRFFIIWTTREAPIWKGTLYSGDVGSFIGLEHRVSVEEWQEMRLKTATKYKLQNHQEQNKYLKKKNLPEQLALSAEYTKAGWLI